MCECSLSTGITYREDFALRRRQCDPIMQHYFGVTLALTRSESLHMSLVLVDLEKLGQRKYIEPGIVN